MPLSIRTSLLALALFASVGGAQEPTPAERPGTDVVYLLDVSGSMRKHRALQRARELLVDILDKVVQPGTQAALIPFGTGVHEAQRFDVPTDADGADARRAEIRAAIESVRAKDSYTYLFQAIFKGLETLMEFKEKNPGHARYIILVSDGKQLTPRDERSPTLQEIVAHFEGLGFKRGEDWFIYYGHFGAPDDRLRRLLEETGAGKTISLDDLPTLHWAITRFENATIDLGVQRPGDWTVTAKAVALTDANGIGRKVTLRMDTGTLPEGMSLTVEPAEIELTAERTEVDLTITCTGAVGGVYTGASIRVDTEEEGSLHFVETKRIGLAFEIGRPRIDVGTAVLELGRIAPGTSAERTIALIPNEDAAAVEPMVSLDAGDAPALMLDRVAVALSERTDVKVTVSVGEDVAPGEYTARVKLDGGAAVDVVPNEVSVSYSVGFGRVTVGADQLAFDRVIAGRDATATITLTPDEETARLGTEIGCEVKTFAPRGLRIDVPATVSVDGREQVTVKVHVPRRAVGGQYESRLRFTAPKGVKVEPAEVPLTLEVVAASELSLPPVVDLGDVPASKAREVSGSFELAVDEHHAGLRLELVAADGETAIEPRVIDLAEGTAQIPVVLRGVGVDAGAREARFNVFYNEDGIRTRAGDVTFRWRVLETYFKVASWSGPAAVPNGDAEAGATLVIEASPDLAGRRVRVANAVEGLAAGMEIELSDEEFVLEGGLQSLELGFAVKGARTGHYQGSLSVGLTEAVEGVRDPGALRYTLEVAGATVYATHEGGLDELRSGSERELTLVLTASAVPAPAELSLAFDRADLPPSIQIDVPASVVIEQADGVTRVPLRVRATGDVQPGSWRPKITVKSQKPGIAVSPETVVIKADVAEVVTVYREASLPPWIWYVVAGCVVLLAGIVALVVLRRKPEVVHVQAPAQAEPEAPAYDDDLVIEDEEDMLVLEGFEEED